MASDWERLHFDGADEEYNADQADHGHDQTGEQIPERPAGADFSDFRSRGAGYSLGREADDATIDDGETDRPPIIDGIYHWAPPPDDLAAFEQEILGISAEEVAAARYEREVFRAPAARGIYEILESAQTGLLVKYGPEDPGEPIRTLRMLTDNGELVVKTSELEADESDGLSEPLFFAPPRPERANEQAYRLTVEACHWQALAHPGQDGESLPVLARVRLGFNVPSAQDADGSTRLVELSLEALDANGQPDPEKLAGLRAVQEQAAPEGVNPADAEEAYKVGLALDIVQQVSWTDQVINDFYAKATQGVEHIEPIDATDATKPENSIDQGHETDGGDQLKHSASLRAARVQFVDAARLLVAGGTDEQGHRTFFNPATMVSMIELLAKAANDQQLSDGLASLDDVWGSFDKLPGDSEAGDINRTQADIKDEVSGLIQQLEAVPAANNQLQLARAYAIDGWQLHNQESQMKLYALLAAEKRHISAARLAEYGDASISGELTQAILSDVVDNFSRRECDTSDLLGFAINDQDRWELSFVNSQFIGNFDSFQRHCKELLAGADEDRYSQQFIFESLPLLIEQADSTAYADEDTASLKNQMLETYLAATRRINATEVNLEMSIDYGIRLLSVASASGVETLDGYINDDIEHLTDLIADPSLRGGIVASLAGMRAMWSAALAASSVRRQSPEDVEKQLQSTPEPIDWNDARMAAIEQYVSRGAFASAQKLLQKLTPSQQLSAYVATWNKTESPSELAELNPQSNPGVHVYTPELPALYERAKALVAEDPDVMIRQAVNTAREIITQVHQPRSETQPNPGALIKLEWAQLSQLLWRVAALGRPDKARDLSRGVVEVFQDEPVWLLHTRGGLEDFYEVLVNSDEPGDHQLALRSLQATVGPGSMMPENRAVQLALVTRFGNRIA